jgi:cytochrome c biogenesis protein CcmG/thiol:disulfide interchange protein DsbE
VRGEVASTLLSAARRGGKAVVALVVPAAVVGCGVEGPGRAPAIGEIVPAYGASTLAGDTASLEQLRGQVVLLNVWATWCPPCRREIPVLQALHEAHADDGLRVVGVSVDAAGEAQAVRQFVDGYGVTFDIWLDPGERVSSTFRTSGVPTTLLIDRDGRLVWRHLGPVTADDAEMNRALAETLDSAE